MKEFLFAVALTLLSVSLLIILEPIFGMFSLFIISLIVFILVGIGLERDQRGNQ